MPGPIAVDAQRSGDAEVGRGPQGAGRDRRLTALPPHRPDPPLAPRPLRRRTRSCWRSPAASTPTAGGRCACCPSAASWRGCSRRREPRWWCTRWRCCGARLAHAARARPAWRARWPRPPRARARWRASAARRWCTPTPPSSSRAARWPARAGAPHLVHVREIYAGACGPWLAALWPPMRRCCAPTRWPASRARWPRQFAGSPRARLLYDGLPRVPEPPERAAARQPLGLPPDALRGRAGRAGERLEGPGRARRALAGAARGDRRDRRWWRATRCPGIGPRARRSTALAARLG